MNISPANAIVVLVWFLIASVFLSSLLIQLITDVIRTHRGRIQERVERREKFTAALKYGNISELDEEIEQLSDKIIVLKDELEKKLFDATGTDGKFEDYVVSTSLMADCNRSPIGRHVRVFHRTENIGPIYEIRRCSFCGHSYK